MSVPLVSFVITSEEVFIDFSSVILLFGTFSSTFETLSFFGIKLSADTVVPLINNIVPPNKTETTPTVNLRMAHLCL